MSISPRAVRWVMAGFPWLVAVAAFGLLAWNAAPGVTFHDSGEFALAAATAGIPHPPGAPTWTLLASAFRHALPGLAAARATNLFSALCASLTLAGVMVLVRMLARRAGIDRDGLIMAAELVAALALLGCPAFLGQALTTEQYTLLTALMVWAIGLALRLCSDPAPVAPGRWAALLGLVTGLAVGNHPSQMILLLLGIPAVAGAHPRLAAGRAMVRRGLAYAAGLAAGLLVFLWLPLRSRANPLLDWGNPEQWDLLLRVLARRQWATRPLAEAPGGFIPAWLVTYDWPGQLGWVALLAALLGLIVLARKDRRGLLVLALVAIPYTAGIFLANMRQVNIDLQYLRLYGVSDWHLPLYLLAALLAGVAMAAGARRWGRLGQGALAVVLAVLAWRCANQVAAASLRGDNAPQQYMAAVLEPLPTNAMLMVKSDNLTFMLSYSFYEDPATDRRVVFMEMPGQRKRAAAAVRAGQPWGAVDFARLADSFLGRPDLQPFRLPPDRVGDLKARPLLVDFHPEYPELADYYLPCGFLFVWQDRKVTDDEARAADAAWLAQRQVLPPSVFAPYQPQVREAWSLLYQGRGGYYQHRNMWPEAAAAYAEAAAWTPAAGQVWFCLGGMREQLGELAAAERTYNLAVAMAPELEGPRTALALLRLRAGDRAGAGQWFAEEYRTHPASDAARRNVEIFKQQGKKQPGPANPPATGQSL